MTFTYLEKEYKDLFTFASDMQKNIEYAKAIKSNEFQAFVKEKDPAKGERISSLCLQSINDDVLIFRAGLILNPFMPFSFHEKNYENLKDLGNAFLSFSPTPSSNLINVLNNGLISEYMKATRYDIKEKETYEEVINIEKQAKDDLLYSYYCMGYFLSKSQNIIYENVQYKNIYNFTYFIIKKEKNLDTLGSYLSYSPLLRAYCKYTNENEEISTYLHLCQKLDSSKRELQEYLEKRKEKYNE